jgi:predicted nucleotidyltransferase
MSERKGIILNTTPALLRECAPPMYPGAPLHRIDAGSRPQVLERLRDVLADEPLVAFAFVFGSFTEDRPFHDIDVGVYLDDSLERAQPAANQPLAGLEEGLSTAARFPVDLVVLNGRPVTFLYHVYRGQVLLARNEAQLTSELERTMWEYFDIAPVLEHATREAFGS